MALSSEDVLEMPAVLVSQPWHHRPQRQTMPLSLRSFSPRTDSAWYASVVGGSYDRVKTQKGYKCGAILQVDKTALRKDLEKAGVVRSLSSGF